MGLVEIGTGDAFCVPTKPREQEGSWGSVGSQTPDNRRHDMTGINIDRTERVETGRFTGPRAEELGAASLCGVHDAEAGSVEEIGYWYGLFAADAIILQVDSCGFVHSVEYEDEATARGFWEQLVDACNMLAE